MRQFFVLLLFLALLFGCNQGSAIEKDRHWVLHDDAPPGATAVYWDPASLKEEGDIRGAWWKLSYDPPVHLEGGPIRAVIFFQEFNCASGKMHFSQYYYVRESGEVTTGGGPTGWLDIQTNHDYTHGQELCTSR